MVFASARIWKKSQLPTWDGRSKWWEWGKKNREVHLWEQKQDHPSFRPELQATFGIEQRIPTGKAIASGGNGPG